MKFSNEPMGPGWFILFRQEYYGGDDAPTLIVYDEVPTKTIKKVAKKLKKYREAKKPVDIEAVVNSMVDVWEKNEIMVRMEQYRITQEKAIEVYKNTLRELLLEEELMLLLFLLEE